MGYHDTRGHYNPIKHFWAVVLLGVTIILGGREVKSGSDLAISHKQPGSVPSWTIRRDLVFQSDTTSNEVANPAQLASTPSGPGKADLTGTRKYP